MLILSDFKMNRFQLANIFLLALAMAIILNLLFLDWQIVELKNQIIPVDQAPKPTPSTNPAAVSALTPTGQVESVAASQCPQACSFEANRLKLQLEQLSQNFKTHEHEKTSIPTARQTLAKELTVNFGSGQTSSKDWENIPGLNAYINSLSYPNIKSIQFETSLRILHAQGDVQIRLRNLTDQRFVFNSEMTATNAPNSTLQQTQINLDSGNKLYQVQARSTWGSTAFIDSARIKIVLQ